MSDVRHWAEMVGGTVARWPPRRAQYSDRRAVTLFLLVAVVYAIGAESAWMSACGTARLAPRGRLAGTGTTRWPSRPGGPTWPLATWSVMA
jgi:hypothetical protein